MLKNERIEEKAIERMESDTYWVEDFIFKNILILQKDPYKSPEAFSKPESMDIENLI